MHDQLSTGFERFEVDIDGVRIAGRSAGSGRASDVPRSCRTGESGRRVKAISLKSYFARLDAIRTWGLERPHDLSAVRQPVLAGHGGILQFHGQFVAKALEFLQR